MSPAEVLRKAVTSCGYMGPGGHGCYLPSGHPVKDDNHDHRFPMCRAPGETLSVLGRRHFCTHLKGHRGPCNFPVKP